MHLEQQHAEFGPETSDASLVDRTVDSDGQITESSPSRRAKSPSQRRLTAVLKAEKAGALATGARPKTVPKRPPLRQREPWG